MIAINPEMFKVIKLSPQEQAAILRNCPSLDYDISYKLANSPNGIVRLTDYEALKFKALLDEQINQMGNSIDTKILCRVSNKLCLNPVISSMAEQLIDRDFKNLEEAQKEADRIRERYNNTPDSEMAGLTPNQVSRLVNLPWDNESFSIKFNKKLSVEDVRHSYFYKNTLSLLSTLTELEDENTATSAGNLTMIVLEKLFGKIIPREAGELLAPQFNRSFNERNVYTLDETKAICRLANLIRKRGRKFIIHQKFKRLLKDENAGELFYLLFTAFFRKFNIAYRDGFSILESIQSTIPFSFYVIKKLCDDFCGIIELEDKIFLPAVRKEITEQSNKDWAVKGLIHTRIIEPLISFDLIEVMKGSKKDVFNVETVRKTRLFDKFMIFSI